MSTGPKAGGEQGNPPEGSPMWLDSRGQEEGESSEFEVARR